MVEYERNPSSYPLQHLKGNVRAVMQMPWFGSPDVERSTIIFTKKGVLDFLAMKKYMLCEEEISKSRRLRELKQLIDKIREEAIQGRMMNEAMFTMPDGIALFAAETESLLVYMGKEAESLWIREKNLSDALYHWAKHLYEGNGVFDKNTTLEILTGILEV